MRTTTKYMLGLLTALTMTAVQPVWAAGPPAPSLFSNPLTLTFIILMVLLLVIIGILANILIGAADVKLKKKKKAGNASALASVITVLLVLASPALFAQDAAGTTATATTGAKTIAGMSSSTFYILATVLFLELFIIMALLINIKFLLKTEKDKIVAETAEEQANKLSWWDRFNSLRPVTEEASLDLGHEYDGIRELNNRLPGWWLYGFYGCIIFAGVYLYRFHVSHTAPSSKQEYERSVARAEADIQEYLKQKGDAVDENTVKMLTGAEDLAAGKGIFVKSCATCHLETGAGKIGPNLTDDYWLHGNDIKNIFKTVRYGINAMPRWDVSLSNKQIAQVVSYVKTLHGTNPPNPKAPDGTLMKEEAAPASPAAPAADSAAQTKKVAMN